jgi:glycosyltransferase involved in cell wall biosynthesis
LFSFHGLLIDNDKWAVYQKAHVLVHPSYWDGQPVTILEAFSFGIPVIATRIGAIPDTIEDHANGYLMKENNATEVCAGAELILGDQETYQRFSRHATRSYEERFRMDIFLANMEDLIIKAL